MRRPPLTTRLLTFALLVAAAPVASAQVPIRVRGAIAKVSGQTLTVVSRDNSTVHPPDVRSLSLQGRGQGEGAG